MTVIYALREPGSEQFRYVGQTVNPVHRLQGHLKESQLPYAQGGAKARWVKSLLRNGKEPEMIALELAPAEHAAEREHFWIERLKEGGHPLLNEQPAPGFGKTSERATKPTLSPRREAERLAAERLSWLKPKEAIEYLGISKATFYRMVKDGRITAYALAGTDDKRYKLEELDRLLTPLPPEPADQ